MFFKLPEFLRSILFSVVFIQPNMKYKNKPLSFNLLVALFKQASNTNSFQSLVKLIN